MNPFAIGIGGAMSLAGMAYSAIKGGQANKRSNAILNKQEQENDAWMNNNRNYLDTVQGKSAIEQVREAYQNRAKQDANTAVVTGATAETEIAQKEAANKGLNNAQRQIASQGAEYTARNEMIHKSTSNNIANQRIGMNNAQADSAANSAANFSGVFDSIASSGLFEKKK